MNAEAQRRKGVMIKKQQIHAKSPFRGAGPHAATTQRKRLQANANEVLDGRGLWIFK